ncbi:MFS transporter [Mycoplasmopsis pulmonis]|uniref:MFS transporter n=1 Tax=Mycoplasmopsis pulmonis TaxID=2107 RepID=UPI002ACDB4EF|nr:MFS transporter [Mycoplasmopsis pulmonis]MDZ7293221.1 MFS transporter [Mycoplasmopsis pulmonis]
MKLLSTILNRFTPRQLLALFILAAADVFVIAAPYYIKNIIPNLHTYLHIKEHNIAELTSVIGYVTLITQLPGGFLANKFRSKYLLAGATLSTGLITIWFAFNILNLSGLSYESLLVQYKIIFGLWGISSTLIFWTPLWKLVSQQTTKENQGLAYGIQGMMNGVIGFVLIFALSLLFTQVWQPRSKGSAAPFATYAFIVAFYLLVTTALIVFLVPEKFTKSTEKLSWNKIKENLYHIIKALSNWKLWMLSVFLLGMYTFQSVFAFYLLQMIENAFLGPTILVATLGGLRTYAMRVAISGFAGRLADKFRSYVLFLIIILAIGIVLVGVMILLPFGAKDRQQNIALIVLSSIIFIFVGLLSWIMVTLRYVQVGETKIEKSAYASSIGILSFIGFSSDAWLYQITGYVGEKYTVDEQGHTSIAGYQIIILISLVIAFVGLLAGLIVFIANTRELKRLGKTNYRWRELENV